MAAGAARGGGGVHAPEGGDRLARAGGGAPARRRGGAAARAAERRRRQADPRRARRRRRRARREGGAKRRRRAAAGAREEAAATRAELTSALDARGGARARGGAETRAARLAGRCERLTRRLYPDGGAPDDDRADGEPRNEADPEHPENLASGTLNSSSDALLVLRATLQGHPVGHDLDVTEALRARLRARGNARLSIAVSENLRAELFGDAFPKVDAFPKAEAGKTGRLIIEYAHAGAYYGGVTPSAVTSNPDAVAVNVKDVKDVKDGTRAPNENNARIRGAACVATVTIGGVDTNEPFAVSSLWIDASPPPPTPPRGTPRRACATPRRASPGVKAKLTRAEAGSRARRYLNPLPVQARRAAGKALAEAARAAPCTQRARQKRRRASGSGAPRRGSVADARARARAPGGGAARDEAGAGSPRLCATSARASGAKGAGGASGERRRAPAARGRLGNRRNDDAKDRVGDKKKRKKRVGRSPHDTLESQRALEPRLRRREQKTRLVAVAVRRRRVSRRGRGGGGGGEKNVPRGRGVQDARESLRRGGGGGRRRGRRLARPRPRRWPRR